MGQAKKVFLDFKRGLELFARIIYKFDGKEYISSSLTEDDFETLLDTYSSLKLCAEIESIIFGTNENILTESENRLYKIAKISPSKYVPKKPKVFYELGRKLRYDEHDNIFLHRVVFKAFKSYIGEPNFSPNSVLPLTETEVRRKKELTTKWYYIHSAKVEDLDTGIEKIEGIFIFRPDGKSNFILKRKSDVTDYSTWEAREYIVANEDYILLKLKNTDFEIERLTIFLSLENGNNTRLPGYIILSQAKTFDVAVYDTGIFDGESFNVFAMLGISGIVHAMGAELKRKGLLPKYESPPFNDNL